jgi:regulator of cell morphogenesis and NO signaling
MNIKEISDESLIQEIVLSNFNTIEIFEKHNVDFYCEGKRTLSETCAEMGLDVKIIVDEINSIDSEINGDLPKFNDMNLTDLSNYIVDKHHSYVKKTLQSLENNLYAPAEIKNDSPNFTSLRNQFDLLKVDLKNHSSKEENILFPYIKYLEECKKSDDKPKTTSFGNISNPINVLESEHKTVRDILTKIKELTQNYSLLEKLSAVQKSVYTKFKEFELDLHIHIHLEDNLLFPKAIELENMLLLQEQ